VSSQGFEPAILTIKRPQTYDLGRTATEIAPHPTQPHYPREITPVPTEQEAWWNRETVWTFRRRDKSLIPAGSYDQKHAGTWRKLEEEAVNQNIVEMAGEAQLVDVKEDDVEELLQSHD